jgi:NADH:ubiquinone oxidoreductase subunit K
MLVISLELLLLSVGLLLVNLSYNLDDLVGSNLTLLILPLAGAESAVALAFLVAFYPLRGSILLSPFAS